METRPHWIRFPIALLALFLAGWWVFDGMHAIVTGDYVTPDEGAYAGQLGPWSKLVEAVGIAPRSNLMKGTFVACGALWCVTAIAYVLRPRPLRKGMLAWAAFSLWFLPVGTVLGLVQLVLLRLPVARR